MIIAVWLCLITHVVFGKIITVNNSGGNNFDCCVNGSCLCSSLSSALHHMSDNTVINITSESVTLHDIVGMGSGNLSNITITGNGATIMCNNTGGVYCESCSDVTIMGITWYQCGRSDSKHPTIQMPALNFTTVSNVIISKCNFYNSSGCPVYLNDVRERIIIEESYFVDNTFNANPFEFNCAGLYVNGKNNNLSVSIFSSRFHGSRCKFWNATIQCYHYAVIITSEDYQQSSLVNISIEQTEFSNNSHGLYLESRCAKVATVQLSHLKVYDHIDYGIAVSVSNAESTVIDKASIHIDISFVTFINSMNPLSIFAPVYVGQLSVTLTIINLFIIDSAADDTRSPYYSDATKLGTLKIALMCCDTSMSIINSQFYNNFDGAVGIRIGSSISQCKSSASVTFTNVTIYNTTTANDIDYASIASVSITTFNTVSDITRFTFTNVSFISNNYSRYNGKVLFIESSDHVYLTDCNFDYNSAFNHVVFLNIKANTDCESPVDIIDCKFIQLCKCDFNNNFGGESIVYVYAALGPTFTVYEIPKIRLDNSTFINNKGTALYSSFVKFTFAEGIFFINNTANSGAAIYFEKVYSIQSDNGDVWFINNSALQKGGALYFDLASEHCNVFLDPFNATFINNSANIAGSSIYFSIPWSCPINNNKSALLYVPNMFKYYEPIHTKFSPIITSLYNVKLYPPAVAIQNSSNDYVMQEPKMLGELIRINASVLDYFSNITEPVILSLNCETCGNVYELSTYHIIVHDDSSLHELKVFPTVPSDVLNNINISITMLALLPPVYKSISVSLSMELSSCHTGYLFDKSQRQCICYPYSDIVHCTEQYVEIKIGYWIGFLTEQCYTSSICPDNYCNSKRTETSPGYYSLRGKSDDQCSSHRTGVACGECKSGYTLAYDSPDCINTDKCSAGMTILVIVLTILYWIAIVAVVFGLMYFQFQISSGYAYGIIYYYSIVDILLVNNASQDVYQLVNILSSFANLTPQLFGQLCLVEGLSGIDQQFIHYSHALAISLILLSIVLVTRYSPRLAVFFGRFIIRVICLLLLLAYTSLASTSLQLLRPVIFNDDDEVHTYSSPDIKYFTGRHLVYAIVAILCEVIIVIGLPLFLLFEPILRQRVNLVRIKPLLDQFQGCYKDKYHWFAAYYLICRQVLILIVYVGNGNYYYMLFGLQTACVIIAMIHGYVQPYKNDLLNGLDEVILLILVLVVNLNLFSLSSFVPTNYLSVVLVILPLLLICLIAIRKLISHFFNKKKRVLHLYNPVEAYEENDNRNNERRLSVNEADNKFQESLLNYLDD